MKYMFKKNVSLELIDRILGKRFWVKEFYVGDLVEQFEKTEKCPVGRPFDFIDGYLFIHDNEEYFTTDEHFEEYLEGIKSESETMFQVHSFNTDEELNAFLVNVEKEDVHLIVPVPMMRNGESTICYTVIVKE